MLHVQTWLRENGGDLTLLEEKFGIKAVAHPTAPLVILNYCQIDSPKRDLIVQECRALTLNTESWEVQARSFSRFYNQGECPDEEAKFDWQNFTCEEKADGSLCVLYYYGGKWIVNTRGSYAQGVINQLDGRAWHQVFFDLLGGDFSQFLPYVSYSFELCTRMNRVVRDYPEPCLYLLSAFVNKSGEEMSAALLDKLASNIKVKRPQRYSLDKLGDIIAFLESHPEATFEGVVLRDRFGLRIKVKSARYVALHRLADNGNLTKSKNIIPLVLAGEHNEVILYLEHLAPKVFDVVEKVAGLKARTEAVWEWSRSATTQKDFALKVKDEPLSAVLFEARKRDCFAVAWETRAESPLIKLLGGI